MLRLIRFHFTVGRMGSLDGMFVLDDEDWATWQKMVESGTEVYFGEVLGKHSDIFLAIKPDHFQVVTEDETFCKQWMEFGCNNGYNPLDYYEPEEDDDEDDEPEG